MSRPYNDSIPKDGSIVQGKVIRLEPAFCILQLLDFFRMRGLLHVSEMDLNGAKMDESISLDDVIYCRVLSVTSDEGPEGRPRQRIKLSTRGVDTITGEESAASVANTQQQQLSQNLNSTIGMGIALDPMANSNLILKSQQSSASALINGYALVGDMEGEPDLPPSPKVAVAGSTLQPMGRGRGTTMPAWMAKGDGPLAQNEAPVRPMGRGRGTTLPAWMTHGGDTDQEEQDGTSRKHDKHRQQKEKKKHSRKRHRDDDDDDDNRDKRHRKKHHRRREERKSRHDNPHNSDRDESSRDKRHRKKHRRRHHEQSPSIGSDRDERGQSRGDSRETTRNGRKSRKRSPNYSDDSDRKRHDRKSRKRSCSDDNSLSQSRNGGRPRSESQASSGGGSYSRRRRDKNAELNHAKVDAQFTSVAEAERLIAELENKQLRR